MSRMVQINFRPDTRTLREFGHVALVGFGVLALLAWYEAGPFAFGLGSARQTTAAALAGLGVLALVLGWVWPAANRVLYVGLSVLTFPIGFVLSYVILGLLFFGVMAPVGWLLRTFRSDPLQREYDATAATYWSPARPKRPTTDYFRQF